jgi:predicted N-acyltransferase
MVSSPIQVKDYLNPIDNTRKEFLQEEDQKIQGRRGIVLKGFKTEKERIEEHLRNVHQLYLDSGQNKTKENLLTNKTISRLETNQSSILNKSRDNEKNKYPVFSSYDGIRLMQPEMRFKPRTDLERLYDEINKNSLGRVNRHLIDKQLRELDLIVTKKTKDENEEEHLEYKPDYMLMTKFSKADPTRDFSIDERDNSAKKEKKVEDKRKKMNVEAKHVMSDLHNKTHFKGATEIANRTGK